MSVNSTEAGPDSRHNWLGFSALNLAVLLVLTIAGFALIGTLDLFKVYGSPWFLGLLACLLLLLCVCLYRNVPRLVRESRTFSLDAKRNTLRGMQNTRQWRLLWSQPEVESYFCRFLRARGYQVQRRDHGEHVLLSAMKGRWNRLGYILVHAGVVLIFLGGLLDANLGLEYKLWRGDKKPLQRDIPVTDAPKQSRLVPTDSLSFRGVVTLPAGGRTREVFLNHGEGYLVQELPFTLELSDFSIERYPSGEPKSFKSELLIHDDRLEEPLATAITVNHPLSYRGYTIYQSSFTDGGSLLQITAWPLFNAQLHGVSVMVRVGEVRHLETPQGQISLELTEFRPENILPLPAETGGRMFRDVGPSFSYRLRDTTGMVREYINYKLPVEQDGQWFFLSGMRQPGEKAYRYLHIPAHPVNGPLRFLRFYTYTNDQERIRQVAIRSASAMLPGSGKSNPSLRKDIIQSMIHLMALFNQGGYAAIEQEIKTRVAVDRQARLEKAYFKMLQKMLHELYLDALNSEKQDRVLRLNEQQQRFFEVAVNSLTEFRRYGAAFYPQLNYFEYIPASGLQITRAPGKYLVFSGCLMLSVGLFLIFFVAQQRLWVWLQPDGESSGVLFAGCANRNMVEFSRGFHALGAELDGCLGNCGALTGKARG